MLFVPGDSARKFAKASGIGADALILDLEDSVAASMKVEARAMVAALVDDTAPRDWSFFVRINPFDTGTSFDDLAAVVKPGLDGILIPKADGADDVARIGVELDRLEQASGMAIGSVKIAVVATETAQAMFNLGSYTPAHPRLVGLTWGAEDLAAAVGATANKEANGDWTFPYQVARSILKGWNAIAGARGGTALPGASRSIPIRSQSSTAAFRHRRKKLRRHK
jgi:citrate lyase subunit beta / citryl-CoA lyase